MVHETIQGTFRQTNLANESAAYLATFRRKIGRPTPRQMKSEARVRCQNIYS